MYSMTQRTTSFNLEYFISVAAGLTAGFLVHRAEPRTNSVIKFFIVPLTVAYFMLVLINSVMPSLNQYGNDVRMFVENKTLGQINNLGYIEMFPPLFAVLIIFLVLLYNGNMG